VVWRQSDPQGNESGKIKWELVPYTRGRVLDVGCGNHKPFAHFIGADNNKDAGIFGIVCKPDLCMDADNLELIANGSMDAVYSSHTLEHMEEPRRVLKHWWSKVKVGGFLILYLPHKDFYPNIGQPGANKDHKWDFVPDDVIKLMDWASYDLIRNEDRSDGQEYSFFQVYKKLPGTRKAYSYRKPKPSKSAGVVRYGAFGDLLQVSSVVAGLKEQGYHVTLYTSPPGCQVIATDPNIDEIVLQDKDQVPNLELGQFWDSLKKKHDKFVNLSESCEGALLALPGRTPFMWSPLARHNLLNKNYMEIQHQMAGVPHKLRVKFYPTQEERQWAIKERKKMGRFTILWALAGSGVHKTWGYVDAVVASLMLDYKDVDVIFVGDHLCALLEKGWENEKRVHCRSGMYSIRQTMSMLEHVDLVIGPETGVLNGASCLSVPKIIFLSHSTVENLTRDWVNTTSLAAESVKCKGRGDNEAPACHQLHYSWTDCNRVMDGPGEGTAECQKAIGPEKVLVAIDNYYQESLQREAA
jgi:ADP-heptose:LPS heptosyltransferase/SAM-dependent methyltransferase